MVTLTSRRNRVAAGTVSPAASAAIETAAGAAPELPFRWPPVDPLIWPAVAVTLLLVACQYVWRVSNSLNAALYAGLLLPCVVLWPAFLLPLLLSSMFLPIINIDLGFNVFWMQATSYAYVLSRLLRFQVRARFCFFRRPLILFVWLGLVTTALAYTFYPPPVLPEHGLRGTWLHSAWAWADLLAGALLVFCIAEELADPARYRRFWSTFLLLAWIPVLLGLYQFVAALTPLPNLPRFMGSSGVREIVLLEGIPRVQSIRGEPGEYGLFLMALVFPLFALLCHRRLGLAGFLLFGLAMTNQMLTFSRGALPATALTLPLLLVLYRRLRLVGMLLITAALVASLFFSARVSGTHLGGMVGMLTDRVGSSRDELVGGERRDPTLSGRYIAYQYARTLSRAYPVFGVGMGNYVLWFADHYGAEALTGPLGVPQAVLTEMGAVGLLVWLFMFGSFLRGLRAAARATGDTLLKATLVGVFGALTASLIQYLSLFPRLDTVSWLLVGVGCAGYRLAFGGRRRQDSGVSGSIRNADQGLAPALRAASAGAHAPVPAPHASEGPRP